MLVRRLSLACAVAAGAVLAACGAAPSPDTGQSTVRVALCRHLVSFSRAELGHDQAAMDPAAQAINQTAKLDSESRIRRDAQILAVAYGKGNVYRYNLEAGLLLAACPGAVVLQAK